MPLAPWCANEKWTFGVDPATGKHWAAVTGRERTPANYLRNPVWLASNDYEQALPDWFHPTSPLTVRKILWLARNPAENANLFLLGIADRNYRVDVVEGYDDPMVVQADDVIDPATGKPGQGVRRLKLTLDDGTTRTWFNYCKGHIVISSGIQPSGLNEQKFNL